MASKVWIVIVNYRTAGLAVDCLRSLAGEAGALSGGRVVVVDNASGDGSVDRIAAAIRQEGWSGWAQALAMARNGGFAYGNNAGIRQALDDADPPEYLLLLNPDTVVRPGALAALAAFMDAHPRAGIAGSRLENPAGGVDSSAHRIHSPLGELDRGARLGPLTRLLRNHVVSEPARTEAHTCDWVSGASLMVRRAVLEAIGGLDEAFFLYYEEVDFCWRARRAGWEVWYVPESKVLHLEGAATGIKRTTRRAGYWYDSRRRFFVKHHGWLGLLAADALWAIGRILYLSRRCLRLGGQGPANDPRWLMFDLLWGDLRAFLTGRTRVRPVAKERAR